MIFSGWSIADLSTWQWSDTEQVIATTGILTLLALILAAIFTWKQVEIARDARRERNRPFVIVDIEGQHKIFFRLVLKNIGYTIASNVSVSFSPTLASTLDTEDTKVADVPFLTHEIPSLPPGKAFGVLFDRGPDRITRRDEFPDRYEAIVKYTAYDGAQYEEAQVLDLGAFWYKPELTERGLHDIYDELNKMRRSVHGINQAIANLQPRTEEHFPPLPRAVAEPRTGVETTRGVGGEGYPRTDGGE